MSVRPVTVDLADPDLWEIVSAATKDLEVGMFVYNAMYDPQGRFLDLPIEQHLQAVAVNCTAPTILTHELGRRMAERGRGSIVLVSSTAALQGIKIFASYGAGKAYGLILAEGLWDELRPHPERTYVEEVYQEAVRHLQRLYESDGFLAARIEGPSLELVDRGRSLIVRFGVDEGPQTLIRSITFGGNAALDDMVLERALELEPDDPLDRYEVEQARRRLLSSYRSEGYIYADVQLEEYLSEDGLSADLHYYVDEGDQVIVGRVEVRGNDRTQTALIRERVALRPGAVYTPQAAQRAQRALIDLGIFATVSVSLVDAETPGPVKDVLVEVSERRPQHLEIRGGFSTADGPRGSLRYGYDNLFGHAVGIETRFDLSYQVFFLGTPAFQEFVEDLPLIDRLERLIVASLNMPHLPVIGRAVALRLDATHERDNDPGFGVTRYGTSLTISGAYRPYLTAQLRTGVEFSDIEPVQDLPLCIDLNPRRCEGMDPAADCTPDPVPEPGVNCIAFCTELRPDDPESPDPEPSPGNNCIYRTQRNIQLARQPRGSAWFWVTRGLLSIDLRDNPFSPTRGFYGSFSAEHVHSLSPAVETIDNDPSTDADDEVIERTSEIIKLTVLLNGYIPLGFLDWVFAVSVRFGWIFELRRDTFTFPDRYFYLGGFDAMRGWAEDSVPAEDQPEPGGQSMLLLRGELRIPVARSFGIGIFADAGNIWRQQTNLWSDFNLRVSVGAGIRYQTPVGPLVLDLGWAIPTADDLEVARADLEASGQDPSSLDLSPYFTPYIHFSIGVF